MVDENITNHISGVEITPEDVEAILDMARTARMLQDYINDPTAHGIAKLMTTVLKITNAVMSTDLVDVMERSLQDPQLDKALLDPPKVGMGGLFREMKDEDLQKGLGVMLELLKAVGRASSE